MGVEIERKFLLKDDSWRAHVERSKRFAQGYLASGETATARVRLAGDQAWLTIKGRRAGISRHEFEYPIPADHAQQILEALCGGRVVEKIRHWIPFAGHTWEIDEFEGVNAGLVLAEVELGGPDESVEIPGWIGCEVSEDPRYYNAYLAEHPYRGWK